jgi:hypothetical protein
VVSASGDGLRRENHIVVTVELCRIVIAVPRVINHDGTFLGVTSGGFTVPQIPDNGFQPRGNEHVVGDPCVGRLVINIFAVGRILV